MRIVADADILAVDAGFSAFGELVLVPGRELTREVVRDADALLVRSITRVDADLLEDSTVKFVGTATSGTDHVDINYLKRRSIQFADARGSNANAVTDYCFAALSHLCTKYQIDPLAKSVAIVGAGNVGGLLARKLTAIGMQCVAFDPLLTKAEEKLLTDTGVELVDFDAALSANIVSLHVPLTREGQHLTYHRLGESQLEAMAAGTILINTSRGAVVSNEALKKVLRSRGDLKVVLDVWENEPAIDLELLELVSVATPHIAGYSVEAKLNATVCLQRRFCDFFQIEPGKVEPLGMDDKEALLLPDSVMPSDEDCFCNSVLARVFPIMELDRQLRAGLLNSRSRVAVEIADPPAGAGSPPANQGGAAEGIAVFDRMRRQLVDRHEYRAYALQHTGLTSQQKVFLQHLGFSISPR